MIKLLRVDDRLLHGQVAFTWTRALGVDCILIANDEIINDEFKRMTIGLAKPQGVKLVIKNLKDSVQAINSGKTDQYKLLIVTDSIRDAAFLASNSKVINNINLGGIRAGDNTKMISKAINISENDALIIRKLVEEGIEVEIRQVPTETKIKAVDLI